MSLLDELGTKVGSELKTLGLTKVDNARVLTDVPAGAVFTDTTDAETIDGLPLEQLSHKLFETSNTGNISNQYSKVARVTLDGLYYDSNTVFNIMSVGDGDQELHTETVVFGVKQQEAFGNNPKIMLSQYKNSTSTFSFGYTIIQNTPNTIVDLYCLNLSSYRICVAQSINRNNSIHIEYYSRTALSTTPPTNWIAGSKVTSWNSFNDGAGSGLDADRLNNYPLAELSTPSTVVARNGSGDINARLFRSEYDTTNASINYIMTQIDTAGNNYMRPSTPAQVAAALNAAGAGDFDAGHSFATNGYQKLGNGLIIQWGRNATHADAYTTFPIAFPSVCATVLATLEHTTANYQSVTLRAISNTRFYKDADGYTGIHWIAIGY